MSLVDAVVDDCNLHSVAAIREPGLPASRRDGRVGDRDGGDGIRRADIDALDARDSLEQREARLRYDDRRTVHHDAVAPVDARTGNRSAQVGRECGLLTIDDGAMREVVAASERGRRERDDDLPHVLGALGSAKGSTRGREDDEQAC